jgi:sigma-B regulation protein RsbU (phosphoserine phosphatase)
VKALATAIISPKQLCEKANRIISNNTSSDKFITFFAGVLDSTNSRFTYVNAGHNPPIVFRPNGSEQLLNAGGAVLGVFEDGSYEQAEVSLSRGDRILLYTDGVTEVLNPTGEEFSEGRLIDLVRNTATKTAAELQQAIMTSVSQFCRGNFLDDVTIVAILVK